MIKTNFKILYRRAQTLNLLIRDLERISGQLDPSRVIRFALRRLGEALQADLVIQVDLRRADGSVDRPYTLALTPKGQKLLAPTVGKFDRKAAVPRPASAPRPTGTPESGRPPESVPLRDDQGRDDPSRDDPGGRPGDDSPVVGARFLDACRDFLRRPADPGDADLLLLRILSEDRPVALLGFRRPGKRFSRPETHFGQEAAQILSENLTHRERERAQTLKDRIYAKIIAELRPEDVLYQILHGLKRILQYDHGACVLLLNPDASALTVQAEIISWTKAKSDRIGKIVPYTEDLKEWLHKTRHPVLLRSGDGEAHMPQFLRHPLHGAAPGTPPVRVVLAAVLRHRGHDLGILKIRSRNSAAFTPADLNTLDQFLPLASLTLYNSTLYKIQHDLLLSAERKTTLANLARAISHDLNNAFGVMLPLLQTLRRDVQRHGVRPEQAAQDLEMIERYAASSSRIFQGFLSMAQGEAEAAKWSSLDPILEGILRMLGPNLEAKGIQVRRELSPALPTVFLRRGEMEQLFLNLIYNARDAMPSGGVLTVKTSALETGVRVEIADTGLGIPEEIRGRIFEPFFTTKDSGTGLGLDICRSIVWDYDGKLDLVSAPGEGTRASVDLPRLAARLRIEAQAVTPSSCEEEKGA